MKKCIYCGNLFDSAYWFCPRCGNTPIINQEILSFLDSKSMFKSSFETEYFPKLYMLEAGNFWFRHRNNLLIWAIKKYFLHANNFLEIGCGTGYVMAEIHRHFPQMRISAGDLFLEGINYAKTRVPSASFYQMDACNIPFVDEFDVIGAFDIIEHIEDDEEAIKGIYVALKKNGGVILTVPQHPWIWSIQDDKAFHKRRYTRNELEQKMKSTGFKIMYTTSFISLLFPFMFLSRMYSLVASHKREGHDELRELRMNVAFNGILKVICKVEEMIIRKRFPLPFGGSLLCIGLKELHNAK